MKLYKKFLACNWFSFILIFFFFLVFGFVVSFVFDIIMLLTPIFLHIIFTNTNISATIVQCAFNSSINHQLRNFSFDVVYHFEFIGILINVHVGLHNLLHFLSYLVLNAVLNIFQMVGNVLQLHCIFVFLAYHNLLVK